MPSAAATFGLISRCLSPLFGAILFVLIAIVPAAAQQGDLNAIIKRFNELRAAGNYPAALVEAQKVEALVKARFGVAHAKYGFALYNLAVVYREQGKYADAEGLYKRALAIYEKTRGADHPDVANILNNLAGVYWDQGKYADAEELFKRVLTIEEKASGAGHPDVATTLNNLALVYWNQGKYADAEELHKRALAIREKALGKGHPLVASTLNNLALVYLNQGKYADAEGLHKRALAIYEKALGADHPDVANSLNGLAVVYREQGKYADAEGLYKRALAICEKALGRDHPNVAVVYDNLAQVYLDQGKHAEAERLFQRALSIQEAALGENHPGVATTLNNLAVVYDTEGKYGDAEGFYRRALITREKVLGENHPDLAATVNNLAYNYTQQGKTAEAERLYRRALSIQETALGENHRSVAITLNNLASLYKDEGRYAEADSLYRRALAIAEEKLGKDHPDTASSLTLLANVDRAQGRYAEAEARYKRALTIREAKLSKDHPSVALTLYRLATFYEAQGNYGDALPWSRKASAAVLAHAQFEGTSAQQKGSARGLVEERSNYFRDHVAILYGAGRQSIEPQAALAREGFETAQWAIQSSAGAALAQMAAREARGGGALAQLVRERQDLERQWRVASQQLDTALGRGNVALASELRSQLSGLEAKFTEIDARLAHEFPDYAELSNPKPLSIADAQALLGADEALLFWLANNKESYVFALTRDGFDWKSNPLGAEALAQKVAAFQRGLDVDVLHRGLERLECTQIEADKRGLSRVECGQVLAKECQEAEKRGLARSDCATGQAQRELFDLGLAHELYDALIGPVEPLIKDKRHLMVVPSGALTALPFHLLVTEKPAPAPPGDLAAYRNAQWLLKRHAVSVLPSVASLKAVRVFARKDDAKSPLIGFGDPVFNAEEEGRPGAENRTVVATRSYTEFWNGVDIDRSMLSKALPRLPETAAELRAVAQNLGAPPSSIYLRQVASETTVKRAALFDYRVVYFATHGLVAGEVKGLAEPSLALTLPKMPSDPG
jgi:tetratricopeptide (TPR) repeat protein